MIVDVISKITGFLNAVCKSTQLNLNLILRLLSLVLVMLVGSAHAADIYKYQDENGRWIFTDKKPKNKAVKKERLLVTEAKAKVSVVNRGSRERPKLVAVNNMAGPVQFWLDIQKSENMRITSPAPHVWLVPAMSEQFLTALEKQNPNLGWSYQWQEDWAYGPALDIKTYKAPPLALPFAGGPFIVSQGFHGAASHNTNKQAYFAVDITMPKGTPILAALGGTVMDVERDFSRSGWSDTFADEANFVRVLHEDGSMAVYAHLDPDSTQVGTGQRVLAGDVIAYSGSTGYSTGPHLHFALQVNEGKSMTSVPFKFLGVGEPKVGMALKGEKLK